MASVSSLGAGSGMNLQGLLDDLMKIERQPLDTLKKQVTSFNTKISAMGTLASKLSALQTAAKDLKPNTLQAALDKYGTFKGSVGNESVAAVTVGEGARTGSYNLEVTQLAQGQKSRLDASNISSGGGAIAFSFADSAKNFSVTPASGSLEDVAKAINQAGKGVTATIVNGNGGQQLILNGQEGAENAFTVGGAGVTGSVNAVQSAQNAELKIDGISVSSASNTVKDALSGVSLQLKATNAGAPTSVKVEADYGDKLKKGMESFVKAFNDVVGTLKSLGAYDAEAKTAGTLNGNRVLRETETALRNLVFDTSSALKDENNESMALSKLGITFQKDGTLSLDSDKLTAAIDKDPALAANFTAEIGNRFSTGLDKLAGTGGTVASATDSLRNSVRSLEKRQEAMETRLVSVEERYRKQFSALDSLVSSMNSTSSYLVQQLSSLR